MHPFDSESLERHRTITEYQRRVASVESNGNADRPYIDLMSAVGNLANCATRVEDANTKPIAKGVDAIKQSWREGQDIKCEAEAAIGAALFNLAIIAAELGLDLETTAIVQLKRLDGATNSGRLRALAGREAKN